MILTTEQASALLQSITLLQSINLDDCMILLGERSEVDAGNYINVSIWSQNIKICEHRDCIRVAHELYETLTDLANSYGLV